MTAVMPAVLLLHYYYDNYNALPCPLCYYYTTITTTTTRCGACRATTTPLPRQLQRTAVPAVLLLHYYYDSYNTLPCPLCYYYTTTTINTMHCHVCRDARRAAITILLRQLHSTAVPAVTLLLRQLQHALVLAVQLLHYYYNTYNALPCLQC